MFSHNKRLQYTVRVTETNPGLANLMLEQFGGPQGELAAACRYFSQYLAEDDPGRRDMLIDIATEELSHLEVIGTIVAMLNKGSKGRLSEAAESEAELYRSITGNGNSSHVTQILYGGGPALTNSGGQLWNAGYIDSIGDPSADLRSNIAAEARAVLDEPQLPAGQAAGRSALHERLLQHVPGPGRRARTVERRGNVRVRDR
jgi:Mn-containing catalase